MEPQVALIMGSNSDYPKLEDALKVLRQFGIGFEVRIMSAHRTPDATAEWARNAAKNGIKVILAAAGGAAHLPGVIAAYTVLPVIGIPIVIPGLGGLDSLLSMVQMPGGIPVSTMSAGPGGPMNAALTAVSILALSDPALYAKLEDYRRTMAEKVFERDAELQNELRGLEDGSNRI